MLRSKGGLADRPAGEQPPEETSCGKRAGYLREKKQGNIQRTDS